MKETYRKEFMTLFDKFSYRYSNWQVWNDFLLMTAVSFANAIRTPEWEKREQEYLAVISRYKKEEQEFFPQMIGMATLALDENPEQDFLGEMYMILNLNQHQKGQFFTPYHNCVLMAEIQTMDLSADSIALQKKGYLSVNDPACGAGAMLIAFANVADKKGLDYQKQVLFVAQDIDRTAALMCYVQLSLLGCQAIVIVGDSLAKPGMHPDNEIWYTPMYCLNAWRYLREEDKKKHEKEILTLISGKQLQEEAGGQLNFFREDAS